jgi:predicted transcriptional regulator of viral defense system
LKKRVLHSVGELKTAISIFRQHGGMLRMSDALRKGITRNILYKMSREKLINSIAPGLYLLSDSSPFHDSDLVAVAYKIPKAVIYLFSALSFHKMTTQIPHEIWIAIPRNAEPPRLEYPPIHSMRVVSKAYEEGIETHKICGFSVNVYNREKTIADCFKHRNLIGTDTIIEAIRAYKSQGMVRTNAILHYLKICRVTQIGKPYLEALL